jgi:hypothetical protein
MICKRGKPISPDGTRRTPFLPVFAAKTSRSLYADEPAAKQASAKVLAVTRPKRLLILLLRVGPPLAGAGVIGWLIRAAGAREVVEVLARSIAWLPAVVALEGARIASELMSTRALLGVERNRVGLACLARAQLIANALCTVLPAGRAASEAAKASLLSREITGAKAAVVAVESQTLSLAVNAVTSIVVLGAVCAAGLAPKLAWALSINALLCAGLAAAVALAVRSDALRRRLTRWRRIASPVKHFCAVLKHRPLTPFVPLTWCFAARAAQIALWATLLHAVGAELRPTTPFIAQGLSMVAATAGDLMPAQLGAHDGVFALAATDLGISLAAAVTAATVFHCVQLTWAALGALAALSLGNWRPRQGPGMFVSVNDV